MRLKKCMGVKDRNSARGSASQYAHYASADPAALAVGGQSRKVTGTSTLVKIWPASSNTFLKFF